MNQIVTFTAPDGLDLVAGRTTLTQVELDETVEKCIVVLNALGVIWTAYDITRVLRVRLARTDLPHMEPKSGDLSFGYNKGVREAAHRLMHAGSSQIATVATGDYVTTDIVFGGGKSAIAYVPSSTGRIARDKQQALPNEVKAQLPAGT